MAAITSKVVGSSGTPALASLATNWVGDVAPVDGDTIVVVSGAYIEQDVQRTYGSNTAAVGHGITILATDANTYGQFSIAAGITVTLQGFDTVNNLAASCARNSYLRNYGNLIVVMVSDVQTYIKAHGHFRSYPGSTISGAGYIDYNIIRASIAHNATIVPYDHPRGIAAFATGYLIANSTGTDIGTAEDSSFAINSVTQPGGIFTTRVASIAAISSSGDYFVDHAIGLVYYKTPTFSGFLTINYALRNIKWHGMHINSSPLSGVSTGCSIDIQGTTLSYLGAWNAHTDENLHSGITCGYKSAPGLIDSKYLRIANNTFYRCTTPIQVYDSAGDATHYLDLTGNTYTQERNGGGSFGLGAVLYGRSSYLDVSGSSFSILTAVVDGIRTPMSFVKMEYCTGQAPYILGSALTGISCRHNTMELMGGTVDACVISGAGSSTQVNVYDDNTFTWGNRAVRISPYQQITNNRFNKMYHHGSVHQSLAGFVSNYTFTGNIIGQGADFDMSGGWTLGYNTTHWIDNVEIANNTFDTGKRTINFNDGETTVVLGTRLKIYNNNLSNSGQGIFRPANDGTNSSKLALARIDYNNSHNNTSSNVKQATFIRSSAEYHLNARNIPGVYLHSPSYTLPQAGRELVMVVTGTAGIDLSVTLQWGGGTPVQLVAAQGTSTGGAAASTHTTAGTLVMAGAGWATTYPTWHKIRQVKTFSGAGANQHAMVKSNTADTLTVLPNNITGTWTAPSTTTVFAVFESEVTLTDSTGGTVQAGFYTPEMNIVAGTYTDADISITTNALTADPQYTAALVPQNAALTSSGFGGTFIGAVQPVAPVIPQTAGRFGFGFGFGF